MRNWANGHQNRFIAILDGYCYLNGLNDAISYAGLFLFFLSFGWFHVWMVCVCVSWLGLVTIPFRMSSDVLVLEHLFACGRGCGCAFRRGCLSPATHLNRHNGKRQLSPVGSCAWSFAALNNRIFVLLLIAYGAAAIGGWNVKQNEKNEIPGNVWSSL